jgi:hypothetical protein
MIWKGFLCFPLWLVYCIVISRVVGILAIIAIHAFDNRSSTLSHMLRSVLKVADASSHLHPAPCIQHTVSPMQFKRQKNNV